MPSGAKRQEQFCKLVGAINGGIFLSATEYHSDADCNSRRVGVVVVFVVDNFVDNFFML